MVVRVRIQSGIWVVVLWSLLLAGLSPAVAQARLTPHASTTTRPAHAAGTPTSGPTSIPAPASYSAVPLAFEPNRGQTDRRVAFLTHGPGYVLFLTPTQAVLNVVAPRHIAPDLRSAAAAATAPITGTVLRLSLVGANTQPTIIGQDLLPGSANYLLGPSSAWHTALPTYARVVYQDVYPGVDLAYYGTQGQLEYDYQLAAGVDPSVIQLAIAGAQAVSLDAHGALVLQTQQGTMAQPAPVAYQQIDGHRQDVPIHYVLTGPSQVGFTLGAYDATQPLVIDPVLSYSTYLGGSGQDKGGGIAVDNAGDAFLTGSTASTDYPTTTGAYATSNAGPGHNDVVITKLNAAGTALLYSTYLGGSSDDEGLAIAVDSTGHALVAGQTSSTDFPTLNAVQSSYKGILAAFVTKLNAQGTGLVYSTYLGGDSSLSATASAEGLAVDAAGTVYVAGSTTAADFPTTTNAYSQTYISGPDAFVTKLGARGALGYSTYLAAGEQAEIATDGQGNAYLVGTTEPSDGAFPTTPGAYQTSHSGSGHDQDVVAAKIDTLYSGSSSLIYGTYLGGTGDDQGLGIAVDSAGSAYVTGLTYSSTFPTVNALYGWPGGLVNAYVTKFSPDGSSLLYSTYLGGSSGNSNGYGIAVDRAGNATVTGDTTSSSFPISAALQSSYKGAGTSGLGDAFVSTLNATDSALLFSTYLGGTGDDKGSAVALEPTGVAYIAGLTTSSDFPTTTSAYSSTYASNEDAFVAKLGTARGEIPWHAHWTTSLGAGLDVSVDLGDGHADVHAQDLQIPGQGPDLLMSHTWDSTTAAAGLVGRFGEGWRSDLSPHIGGVLTETVVFTDSTGAVWPFQFNGNPTSSGPYTTYNSVPGDPWQLSTSTAGYTLTNDLNSAVMAFDNQGNYLSDTDAYGNQNTLNYSSTAVLSETNSGGRVLRFTYTGGGLLNEVKSPRWVNSGGVNGQHVSYTYLTGGYLATRTQGAGSTDALTTTYGYSGTELVTITTPAGHAWIIGYDGAGRVASVTSPASGTVGQAGYSPAATTAFSYTPFGQTQVVAGYGSSTPLTTTYTLDGVGEPLTIADGLGDTQQYSYDADHDVLTSTDADGNTTTNSYQYVGPTNSVDVGAAISSTGLLTQTVQPPIQPYSPLNASLAQPTTRYSYDPTTNDLIETDKPEGGVMRYAYDGHHSVITTTVLITGTTQWRGSIHNYNQFGELTSVTDGRGVSVNTSGVATLNDPQGLYTRHLSYSTAGDATRVSTPGITTTLNGVTTSGPVTTTYTYDLDGNQVSTTSANGNTATYGYDHLARPISMTLPTVTLYDGTQLAPTDTTGYDGENHVVKQVDGNGDVTTYSYDPQGRLVATTNPVTGTSILTYTTTEEQAVRDAQGNVTTYEDDAAGRLITATAPISGVAQYQYDAASNTTVITNADILLNPIQIDTRQFDALNRVMTDTISGPNSTAMTTATRYDLDGNIYQVVYPTGNAAVCTYDLADELVSTENDPMAVAAATHQEQSTVSYDSAGNQIRATDFGGNSTSTAYDGDDRVFQTVAITGTNIVTTTNSDDPDGNVLTTTTQTVSPSMPLQTSVDSGAYNAADWLTATTDNGLTMSYGYDAVGRERTRTTASGTITTTLDAEGRVTSISAANAGTTRYGYNADDQPITATLPGSISATMSYDKNSRLTSWNYLGPSTGVTTTTVNLAYNYGYDGANLINAITMTDNAVAQTQPITHDAAGRLVGWTGPNGPQTWSFDGNGDVISTTSYIAGAIRTTTFTYSNSLPMELLQQHTDTLGVDTYSYDGNGNVVSEVSTDPITSPYYVNQHFYYDAQQQPITVTNVLNQATVTATLGYNPLGQNITYTVVMSGQVIDNALYSYDSGGNLARTIATTATLNPDGSIQSSGTYTDTYAYDPEGQPLYLVRQQNGTANAYTYLTDGRDSVVGMVDSTGNRVDRYQYAPYGAPVGLGFWEMVPQLFRNDGTITDPGLGLNDPDGDLTNIGSGTNIIANKGGGFFSYFSFGDDPIDYEIAGTSNPTIDWQARRAAHQQTGYTAFAKPTYGTNLLNGCPGSVFTRIVPSDVTGQTDPYTSLSGDYHLGHLWGANLGGPNDKAQNFVAQTVNANVSSFQKAENIVRRLTNAGYGVEYQVYAYYDGWHALFPTKITAKNGEKFCEPDRFLIQISRTSVPLLKGQKDFNDLYTAYGANIFDEPTPYPQGALCGVADITFDNTAQSWKSYTVTRPPNYPYTIINGQQVANNVTNKDCLTIIPKT